MAPFDTANTIVVHCNYMLIFYRFRDTLIENREFVIPHLYATPLFSVTSRNLCAIFAPRTWGYLLPLTVWVYLVRVAGSDNAVNSVNSEITVLCRDTCFLLSRFHAIHACDGRTDDLV